MASPTQQDIDWLRKHPESAEKFEAHFGVPAKPLLAYDKPTEQDILWLRKNPESASRFDLRFGPGAADDIIKDKTWLRQIRDEERDLPLGDRMSPWRIGRRAAAVVHEVGGDLLSPSNWGEAVKSTADVVARLPEVVSSGENLKEMARGGIQGLLATPGSINDLALAGVDLGARIVAGTEPLEAEDYAKSPIGSATTAAMLEDWGNEATRAAGIGEVFDFNAPATEAGKTARRIGEFAGSGAAIAGRKALLPALTGAVGAEVARDVAPDDPGWQVAGGILGAAAPLAVSRGISAIPAAAKGVVPAARVLTQGGRETIVGDILRQAAGDADQPSGVPYAPPAAAASPIQGVDLTLGQATNNPGILQLEKTMAHSEPAIGAPFKDRLTEAHTAAREAVQGLRGTGVPDDMRRVADDAEALHQRIADETLSDATTGMTPAQASEVARGRLETRRDAVRERRRELWKARDLSSDAAMVDVDPIRQEMAASMSRLPKFFDRKFPADVEETLAVLNEREPLSELQALRSDLGDKARDAAAANNSKMAMVYGNLRDAVGRRLDNLEFADQGIQQAYQTARNFSRLEAEIFKQPNEMRSTLGRNRFGGDQTAPADTLRKFIRPGPAGRDTFRQVMAVDDSHEMLNAIGDYMTAQIPQGLGPAQRFMTKFQDTLAEPQMHVIRDRLQRVIDARAAQQALRDSPLSMFTGIEPRAAIGRVMTHPDRINVVRRLRSTVARSPGAWDGMRAAYVDEIMSRIEAAVERGADGNPTVLPGAINKIAREYADVTREILGPVGEQTIRNVADAVEMMTRTQRGGYPGGSPTYSLFTGDRFVDHVIEKWLMRPEAPWALASGGSAAAGMPGFFAGGAAGFAGQSMFGNAKAQVQMLLRDALLDPQKGRALMMKASQASMKALPRSMRPYLAPLAIRAGAAGAVQTQGGANRREGNSRSPELQPGHVIKGRINGEEVTYRYLGGDPKESSSWKRSPEQ